MPNRLPEQGTRKLDPLEVIVSHPHALPVMWQEVGEATVPSENGDVKVKFGIAVNWSALYMMVEGKALEVAPLEQILRQWIAAHFGTDNRFTPNPAYDDPTINTQRDERVREREVPRPPQLALPS